MGKREREEKAEAQKTCGSGGGEEKKRTRRVRVGGGGVCESSEVEGKVKFSSQKTGKAPSTWDGWVLDSGQ